MSVKTEFTSASCNLTYNALELSGKHLYYASNNALAIYDLENSRITDTWVKHDARINCVRFVKNIPENTVMLTGGNDGKLVIWKLHDLEIDTKVPRSLKVKAPEGTVIVCDGIKLSDTLTRIGYITSLSRVVIGDFTSGSCPETGEDQFTVIQEINLKSSVALDLGFWTLGQENEELLALGLDTGEVALYGHRESGVQAFSKICSLKKHEDWVRCITFLKLENGDTLLATGGEDSYIAIWRFKEFDSEVASDEFEFQVQWFKNFKVSFDSMIIGHEGWINSLQWNSNEELISCSADQTILIWQNTGDIWIEKLRLGTVGGQIPGGFGVKFSSDFVINWGFQGSIQIWKENDGEWIIEPSVTGHFKGVSDLDYHKDGHFIVTTSEDQTSRIFSPYNFDNWHEIGRPQIHGHDLFAIKCARDYIVSGAEEKILRAFEPTDIFVNTLEQALEMPVSFDHVSPSANLPALGLSNIVGSDNNIIHSSEWAAKSLKERLDEEFLRSQTLWPEVSKLYGHVYEICSIASSPVHPIIVSGSQSSKPQFSAIILWSTSTWKNLGEFLFHKLNVTDMEFSNDGKRLLSVSRDRTWAVWDVIKLEDKPFYSLELLESGSFHTRALWVGTWSPLSNYFVTGARDKKLVVWNCQADSESGDKPKYKNSAMQLFDSSVTAAGVNVNNIIAVGLESGLIFFLKYSNNSSLQSIFKLDQNSAHHAMVRRLKFNPKQQNQLASAGEDRFVRVYQLGLD